MEARFEELQPKGRLEHLRCNVRTAMDGATTAAVARDSGIRPDDLRRLLDGKGADMFIVAKLEAYFGLRLWPSRSEIALASNGRNKWLVRDEPIPPERA